MKIKNILAVSAVALLGLSSCSKWTDMEIQHPMDLTKPAHTEEYYKALRDYKNSDHQLAFAYYSAWTGVGTNMQSSLMGLPDSVDLVSLWGGWKNPTEAQLKDLRLAQEKKGLKAMICFLVLDMGNGITPDPTDAEKAALKEGEKWAHKYWGWSSENTEAGKAARRAAVVKYANAICDLIDKYGYDGFDIDAEPSYSHPFNTDYELWRTDRENGVPTLMTLFIETLGKRIGPMAESEAGRKKVLAVDGQPDALPATHAKYFNYFIIQAYGDRVGYQNAHFQGMLSAYKDVLPVEDICKKSIFVVNFESGATRGGEAGLGQILNFALQNPVVNGVTYRKGGVGAFRVDLEYAVSTPEVVNGIDMSPVKGLSYPWWRRAIQLMNPTIK
ncbi:glycoside hydrolase family 18 [Porphyromonas sp. oral taxon 278]|uniref:glycoside hydrolase family 18 n=1 Tax=Porphyromonas sp. oral taxon 278 TaxID=712437 RepID=UPI0025E505ED|nr:glycoside hydrolase family 18 [Porphyromonas sp. oral taxon 278]